MTTEQKRIPLNQDTPRERFRRKAQTAANLSRPHIVPIYGVVQANAVCIVMELLTSRPRYILTVRGKGRGFVTPGEYGA